MKKKQLKFKHYTAGRGGWSEWVYPKMDDLFLFKCCDCGLVHELEFKSFVERDNNRGLYKVIPLPKEIRAMFRARRMKIAKAIKKLILPRK